MYNLRTKRIVRYTVRRIILWWCTTQDRDVTGERYTTGARQSPWRRTTWETFLWHPPPPPSERRMRKWVLVDPVIVNQATSGLVEQLGIHRNARNVQTKGRLPHVPGHSPWREKLRYVLYSDILWAPMLFMQMSQAVTDGALPNSAPFDRAPP